MANDAIRAEIEARLASTLDRYAVTSDRIVRELAKIAFGNVDDFILVQDDGSLVVDFGTARHDEMASLKSIEIDERTTDGAASGVRRIKISLNDKSQALMDLAKITSHAAGRSARAFSGSRPGTSCPRSTRSTSKSMAPQEREQLRELLLTAVRADEAS